MKLISANEAFNAISEERRTVSMCPTVEYCRAYNEGLFKAQEVIMALPVTETEPKWISAKDRLPENYQIVLAVYNSTRVVLADYENGGWWDREFDMALRPGFVTHWMPLPEPPKEVENA